MNNTMVAPTRMGKRHSASILLRDQVLNDTLWSELERNGFEVRRQRGRFSSSSVDVVVTDEDRSCGRLLTARLGDEIEVTSSDGWWLFPLTHVDRLGEVLRVELNEMEGR